MNLHTPYFVSVIIPVFNDRDRLQRCLAALEQQTYPQSQYEVIVVDNGSQENIAAVVDLFTQARVIFEPKPGSYAARNQGVSIAKGEILGFTDADCLPSQTWIECGVQQLLSLEVPGIVAGQIEISFQNPRHPTPVELYDSVTNLQQKKLVENSHFGATANLFTWKKVFESVGLFNEQLRSGGDGEWGKRAFSQGYPIVYSAETVVAHPARYSLKELYKKVKRVSGGFYDLQKMDKKNNLEQNPQIVSYFQTLLGLKPPLVYAYRKSFLDQRLQSFSYRFQVFWMVLLVHYWRVLETFKLQMGAEAER